VVLSAVSVGILEAVSHLGGPRQILVLGDDTSSTSGVGTTLSPAQIAQAWDKEGQYHGFWAGNVETIPAKPRDLPDVFFSGPTPSGPVGSALRDPSTLKKPLWIFGDEVRVSDHQVEIRQAMGDGRPILFYATDVGDAVAALGLTQQVSTDTPLERLIVMWPSSTAGDKAVDISTFNFVAPASAMIFESLVLATLRKDADTNTTFVQAQTTASNSGTTSTETTLQETKAKWGESATVGGGAITVGLPVEDPAAQATQPGFKGLYSVVTITNTGKDPITYAASDFSLEGQSSGSGGISGTQSSRVGGYPTMDKGTLDPGQSVTCAVRFVLGKADIPVKVRLVPEWAKLVLISWQ